MFTNLIIVSPEGWRYETRVLNDTPVAQLTQAFVQTCWKPDPDRFSYRFHLRPLDPGRPSLENLKSLQESGIITGSSLRLETELLKDDAAVALTIQDEDDQRYTTAVLLNTTIAHLAEAFLQEHPGPGELRVDLISGIVDPKVVRQLNPQFSLFAEGIDDYAILRIYRTTQSSQE